MRDTAVEELYDNMMGDSLEAFDAGHVSVDVHLTDLAKDIRRGLTVIVKPSREVKEAISYFIAVLKAAIPGQYFYNDAQLHVTVLSLFPATPHWRAYREKVPAFRSTVLRAVASCFVVEFAGVTASRGGVMIRGFPVGPELDGMRSNIRTELNKVGLGDEIDGRYVLLGAHVTCARFSSTPTRQELRMLCGVLEGFRDRYFGLSTFTEASLVSNDWYMSSRKVRVIAQLPLCGPTNEVTGGLND